MTKPFEGIRVLEVAAWTFVPAPGAILSDLGADVIKVEPNGFLPAVTGHDGAEFRLVAPAMHFDEHPTAPVGPAPELGQDSETILMDVGLDWDEITRLRERAGLG
jgi:crotonobetainyl-CoA:carnitine CoA-transferase CaiB-like acyl-CoA transferase